MKQALAAGGHDTPLEDLMVAMDVVDTIRHRQLIVDRELDTLGRRERLIERLRDIYTAQGIEVSDAALEAGVDALEKERFAYTPVTGGPSVTLARFYVRRDRWFGPLLAVLGIALLAALIWYVAVQLPQNRFEALLPQEIETTYERILAVSDSEAATSRANELFAQAERLIDDSAFDAADDVHDELEILLSELELAYEIRIVSRPGEYSGVWRVPDVNPEARNYYLIVEAVDASGRVLERRVRNEEDGRFYEVRKWGVRVDESTFEAVAADKRDDGIIGDYVLGSKPAGRLEPEYRVPNVGATITQW